MSHIELGPDGKEWAKTEAGYAHVDKMIPRAEKHYLPAIWTRCNQCGKKWADGEGKP